MMSALFRLLVILMALVVCAGVAVVVYFAIGDAPSMSRHLPLRWDEPADASASPQRFAVRQGQSAAEVGDELHQRGLIRSSLAFRLAIESRGLSNRLEAGEYDLSASMSTAEIVDVLARGARRRGAQVTLLEGWRAEQVAQHLEQAGLAGSDELLRIVAAPREAGLTPPDASAITLEGYLFPDTYEIDPRSTPAQIVATLVQQFERRFGESTRRQPASGGLTVGQLVTLASIIEREAQIPDERPLIASVFHNRLAAGMRLDADPTVQYAVATSDLAAARGYGFWKRDLSALDLLAPSPYNTYRVAGLPPGPICNPGLSSIEAAMAPAATRFLYFVARGDGSHLFAETLAQHEQNVAAQR